MSRRDVALGLMWGFAAGMATEIALERFEKASHHHRPVRPMTHHEGEHVSKHKGLRKTQTEPSMIRAAVVAVLGLLASLGFSWAAHVDKGTLAAIVGVVTVVLPIVQGIWTRHAVTPNAKVITRVTTDGQVVAGDAAVAPTGTPLPTVYPTTATTSGGNMWTPVVVPGLPTATVQVNPALVAGALPKAG